MPTESRKWTVAFLFTAVYASLSMWYLMTVHGMTPSIGFLSSLTSATGGFLLATSFSASSLSYFTGWPNMRWGYQKQIGVVAFWACVAYCLTLLVGQPDIYYYGFWDNLNTPNFILGLSAMGIFGLMVFLNSHFVAPHLNWSTIKLFLNLGFLGYAFLVMRAIFLEWPLWTEWFATLAGPPTNRFLLSSLAITVLLLRAAHLWHRSRNRKS